MIKEIIRLENFEKDDSDLYDISIVPKNSDVGGGRITIEEIDVIKQYPQAKSLKISGLNQESFEYLIENYGSQFEAIYFFKNKLVNDLSLLGNLRHIKYVCYFFNQKVTELWDMKNNDNLVGLAIYDFSKLHCIDKISTAPNLQYFAIGNKVWAEMKIKSLSPLINSSVTHFGWWGKNVEDNDFLSLAKSKIEEIDLNICQFEMEELAKIVACIPNLKGTATKPYRESGIIKSGETTIYYLLCKGKRKLVKGKDEVKLEKYAAEFESLVEKYSKK